MARRSDHTKEGYSAFSARKLASKIDYTVGTLYNFFKDQNELILIINSETLDGQYEYISNTRSQNLDPKKALRKVANAYI